MRLHEDEFSYFHRFQDIRRSQEFVDEVHKILVSMGNMDIEKVELASYHLKDVANI